MILMPLAQSDPVSAPPVVLSPTIMAQPLPVIPIQKAVPPESEASTKKIKSKSKSKSRKSKSASKSDDNDGSDMTRAAILVAMMTMRTPILVLDRARLLWRGLHHRLLYRHTTGRIENAERREEIIKDQNGDEETRCSNWKSPGEISDLISTEDKPPLVDGHSEYELLSPNAIDRSQHIYMLSRSTLVYFIFMLRFYCGSLVQIDFLDLVEHR
ncbi:hypothetical protein LENED_008145 [Lentinula edodes]|uniref:Uncharacterized protein n=1 Tax=Lentinula edodes TaxID=5353 RepID=A0A1Q3EGD4_LENED|nr:hypothetical protein LENED_008145 [Lentinula edodes]